MPLMLVHHMTMIDMTLAAAIAGFVKNEVEQG